MAVGFLRSFFATLAGPLVWAGHFLFVYGFNGVICARPALQSHWLGLPWSSWVICGASTLALAAMALLHYRLCGRLPAVGEPRFLPNLARALTLLSALAVVWETVPVVMLPACR